MGKPPQDPLVRALEALVAALPTKDAACTWYRRCVRALGEHAVEDTFNGGAIRHLVRRAEGGGDLLPSPSLKWTMASIAGTKSEGVELFDGRQRISVLYGEDGAPIDRSVDGTASGRLVELARLLAHDPMPEDAALHFVTSLDEGRFGPARVHYPLHAPGGVSGVVARALSGLRRVLFEGGLPDGPAVVAIEGVGGGVWARGSTRDEAVARCQFLLGKGPISSDTDWHTATDDYDDDGNLITPGERPAWPEAEVRPPAPGPEVPWRSDVDPDAWKAVAPARPEVSFVTPPADRKHERIDLGTFHLRGPTPDVPELPERPECTPLVVVPIEGLPSEPPPVGRWWRLLGAHGRTRFVVRIDQGHDFLLVGSDVVGMLDLAALDPALDRIDVMDPPPAGRPEHEPFVRFRTRRYRWMPDGPADCQGLVPTGASWGPRFDAASLDGDALQGQVLRFRKVWRPVV
ncbi:MAG: hypothetical protein AB7T63_16765 [Planctomycetota bacterium]